MKGENISIILSHVDIMKKTPWSFNEDGRIPRVKALKRCANFILLITLSE